jgi:four helix bundle protein
MMFEDLEAWQQARHLVNEIYSLTRENSSLSKDFGLTGQVQRAAVSIMSNVAEGFERTHLPEKIQFYNVARGSTGEVRSLLYVISDNCAGGRTPTKHRSLGWKARLRPFAVDRGTESQTPTSAVASARPNLLSAGFHLPMTR